MIAATYFYLFFNVFLFTLSYIVAAWRGTKPKNDAIQVQIHNSDSSFTFYYLEEDISFGEFARSNDA